MMASLWDTSAGGVSPFAGLMVPVDIDAIAAEVIAKVEREFKADPRYQAFARGAAQYRRMLAGTTWHWNRFWR